MTKDLDALQKANDELGRLAREIRRFFGFNCDTFLPGCYECNIVECPNYEVIWALVWRVGKIFPETGIRMAEEILLVFLGSRNIGLKNLAFYFLEKTRTSGEFLTLKTLMRLDKFKQNPDHRETREKVDSILKAEKAHLN